MLSWIKSEDKKFHTIKIYLATSLVFGVLLFEELKFGWLFNEFIMHPDFGSQLENYANGAFIGLCVLSIALFFIPQIAKKKYFIALLAYMVLFVFLQILIYLLTYEETFMPLFFLLGLSNLAISFVILLIKKIKIQLVRI